MGSTIEWTRGDDGTPGMTWNPTVGCSKVSPGCDHCYAVAVAQRGMQAAHRGLTKGGDWTGEVRFFADRLDTPLHWPKPRRVFVDSMSDLFHPTVPDGYIARVFATMSLAYEHTYQILTKRPQRMAGLVGQVAGEPEVGFLDLVDNAAGALADEWEIMHGRSLEPRGEPWPLRNVWLGASIESDRYTFRADHLRFTPAAVRFLSLEPLLGPLPTLDLGGIDWVIVGGESGPGARAMDPEWVRDIRGRCVAAGVALFIKQAGVVLARQWGCAHRAGGVPSEWPEEFQVRQFPAEANHSSEKAS